MNKEYIKRELNSTIIFAIAGLAFFILLGVVNIIVCVRDGCFNVPLFCILIPFYSIGIFLLILVAKKLLRFHKAKKALVSGIYIDATIDSASKKMIGGAKPAGHVFHKAALRVSLILKYFDNAKECKFKTGYIYTEEEYAYLKQVKKLKAKAKNGFVVIIEEIDAEKPKPRLTKRQEEKLKKARPLLLVALILFFA